MKERKVKFHLLFGVVVLLLVKPVKLDISDVVCAEYLKVDIKNDGNNSTDNAGVTSPTQNLPKRVEKKSLLIVFDGTNSMGDDLEQMRSAASDIVNNLSNKTNQPIKNYVLSVFRDPGTII